MARGWFITLTISLIIAVAAYINGEMHEAQFATHGREQMGSFVVLLISGGIAAVLIYFTPSLVADNQRHPYLTSIFLLNLLLGWTYVGWVLALVWAYMVRPAAKAAPTKDCPRCAETVKAAALVCPYCFHDFRAEAAES